MVVVSAATTKGRGEKPRSDRDSRYFDTVKCVVFSDSGGGSRSASAASRSTTRPTVACSDEVAAADAKPANFDQAGQCRRRTDHNFIADCRQMDTVIADQDGAVDHACAPGHDQIEGKARFAGARRPADQHRRSPTLTAEA